MSVNEVKNLSRETLIDLLVSKTNELLAAMESKADRKDLHAKRKELEKIQLAIKAPQLIF
jgi:hypothetical protein